MATSFFDRESTIAPLGYNRFLVPPAALAVHLSIGQVYAFSTFNLPMTKLLGISASAPGDWNLKQLGWVFSISIAILGLFVSPTTVGIYYGTLKLGANNALPTNTTLQFGETRVQRVWDSSHTQVNFAPPPSGVCVVAP